MNELFAIPESKSPRLLWMERHGFETHRQTPDPDEGFKAYFCILKEDITEGKDAYEMVMAYIPEQMVGQGNSAIEAAEDCAVKRGIPLWNEEGAV